MMTSLRPILAAAVSALLCACAGGAPPGFSAGDTWVFPLVGPLEGSFLVTPVTVGGKGPYLFLIDPDASASSIDERLAKELGLYTALGPRLIDESDTSRPTKVAELPALTVGTLTVKNRVVTLHRDGAYAVDGRDVRGVLGRDVIADSLVFGFDRDAGMAFLATRETFTPPAQALRIGYDHRRMRRSDEEHPSPNGGPTGAVQRRVARVHVNDGEAKLHLDLGAVTSQLRPSKWKALRLAPVPFRATAIDEVGTTREIDKAGIVNHLEVGGATAMGLAMIPYADARWDELDVDGTLGLDFFAPYAVWADWHERAFYLRPRDGEADLVARRIDRWNAPVLSACKAPACASARLEAPPPPAAPTTPPVAGEPAPLVEPPILVVERTAEVADITYELMLEAVGADGRPLGLPRLVVTFPAGQREVRQHLTPAFVDARFRVLDVSPFVRPCPSGPMGCVFELAPTR